MSRRRKQKTVEKAIRKKGGAAGASGNSELTTRRATARGRVNLHPALLTAIMEKSGARATVLESAKAAGMVAAKRASDIVPSCHPQEPGHVQVRIEPAGKDSLSITAETSHLSQHDVDTAALVAVAASALAIYETCRDAESEIVIADIRLVEKSRG